MFRGLGTFKSGSYISYGFADASIAILEGSKGFEVGTGDSMRPYLQHYRGNDEDTAVITFINRGNRFIMNTVTG